MLLSHNGSARDSTLKTFCSLYRCWYDSSKHSKLLVNKPDDTMFDVMTCLRMMSLHVMSSATCWVPLLRVCNSSNSSEHLYLHGAIN